MTTTRIDQSDADTIEELYPALRRFAAVTAPWDMEPDDVLHGALARVLRSQKLHQLDNPGAYIRRAIVNEVADQLRKRKTARSMVLRLRPVAEVSDPYPSDVADLLRLSPNERAVLFLHDIEGRPFEDVAEMVGISAANARTIASRARRRLKAEILEETS